MRTGFGKTAVWACLLGSALVVGCGKDNADPNQKTPAEKSEAWKEGLDEEKIEAFSKLSDQDRTIALEQKTCVVSKEDLGSMGTPIKVTANNKTYFICCEGCRAPFEKNPEKYISAESDPAPKDPAQPEQPMPTEEPTTNPTGPEFPEQPMPTEEPTTTPAEPEQPQPLEAPKPNETQPE